MNLNRGAIRLKNGEEKKGSIKILTDYEGIVGFKYSSKGEKNRYELRDVKFDYF